MKSFLDKAGKFLLGLFGVIISVFGIISYFQKSEALSEDDKLADSEAEIDGKIEDLKKVEPADLSDSDVEKYWEDL